MKKRRSIRPHTKRKRYWILPDEVRKQIIALARGGGTYRSILASLDVSRGTITNVLKPLGGVIRPEHYQPSQARLSLDDRYEIRVGLELDESYRAIATRIGRHHSTVCREVKANGGRGAYRPAEAHRRACRLARRPKPTKLASSPRLRTAIVEGLQRCWSPEQIANLLVSAYPDDQEMRVSHETIYRSIYVQGRGELRRELARCLRTGRAKRIPRGRMLRPGRLPDMVLISERPAEVEDRAVPGHWEGDLILGKNGKSAIGTLVERSTRYLMLLHLPADRTAASVRDAMTEAIGRLPAALRRSLTWDQGREMAEHVRFSVETGVQVYFCDPASPWQRGSNENTNGLLRQFFPKGTDLSVHDRARLDEVEDLMNTRPRKTLGWDHPSKRLAELVASTS